MFMWFGCWSKVIPTSHLPWGYVVEDETLHCQMSEHTVMYSENTNPTADVVICWKAVHTILATSIQQQLGSCWSYS